MKKIYSFIKKLFNFPQDNSEVTSLAINQKIYKKNKIYLYDNSNPNLIKEEIEPAPFQMALNIKSIGESGGGYPLGSVQQQALATKQIVNNALNYFVKKTNKKIKRWSAVNSLTIMPRAGKDVNAYYDRSSLRFFYFSDPSRKKTIFACDSTPVITHELGHAFLDILRPDWWNVQAMEIWSIHEAFGDIFWLLSATQNDTLINLAIEETNGDLYKSNIITRMAADMAKGLFNITKGQGGLSPNYLRDMSLTFRYTEPELLPSNGLDSDLINECHSFSRIFSCAFYKLILEVANTIKNSKNVSLKESIKLSGDILSEYLFSAILICPTQARAYNALVNSLLIIDSNKGSLYQESIKKIFTNCNILKEQVMMLNNVSLNDIDLEDDHEIKILSNKEVIVKTISNKKIKMSDHVEVSSLSVGFLTDIMDLEIEIASQKLYHFDQNNNLVSMLSVNDQEALDAAHNCLKQIADKKLFGKDNKALFDAEDGKLIRKQIICRCNKPNYCNPQAPEYGKPKKPKNQAGCNSCYSNAEPRSCECEEAPAVTPPKTGCFTTVKSLYSKIYRVGSKISRKVC